MKIPLYARNFEDRMRYKTKLEVWHDKEKEIVDIPFKPYFYSRKPRSISVAQVEMERLKFISDLHSETLYKYNFNSVKDIPLYRDEDSLEADIPYIQRVAIDAPNFYTRYPQTKPLDMFYFDIETDTSGAFPKPERNIITALSYALNDGELVTYTVDNIKQGDANILEAFTSDIKKLNPDSFVGYNSTYFDIPYIIDRLRMNGMSDESLSRNKGGASFVNQQGQTILNIQGRVNADVFREVKLDQTLFGISDRKLKTVGKFFNVEKKIQQLPGYEDYKMILEDLGNIRSIVGTPKLKKYIESDVLITRELSRFYFNNVTTFAEMLRVPISVMTKRSANLIGTIVYARELAKKKIISDDPNFKRFPTVFGIPEFDERRGRYSFNGGTGVQGALVGLFKDGKSLPLFNELKEQFKDVYKLDFASLYPTIQRTFNLSPETTKIIEIKEKGPKILTYEKKDGYSILGIPDRKMGYVLIKILPEEGFLPIMLTELHHKRLEIKAKLKDVNLSEHEREGLESLSWSNKVVQNMNYGLGGAAYFRYSDLAVTIATTGIGRFLMQMVLDVNLQVNIACDTDGLYLTGVPDVGEYNRIINEYIEKQFELKSYLDIEVEGPYPNSYFLKRKNYILQREDKVIIKHGNSFKGSAKNVIFSYALERLIDSMFNNPKKIKEAIKDCFKLDERNIKDYIQRTGIHRPLSEYASGSCLQVAMARQYADFHNIEVTQGDSIEYVKQEGGYVIRDLAKLRKIDKKYYLSQVKRVLERLNLTQVSVNTTKGFKHKMYKRGRSGYIFDGQSVCQQVTLDGV